MSTHKSKLLIIFAILFTFPIFRAMATETTTSTMQPGELVETLPSPTMGPVTQPDAHIPEKSFDAGTVQKEETVSHDFKIQNNGDADLIVEKVSPG